MRLNDCCRSCFGWQILHLPVYINMSFSSTSDLKHGKKNLLPSLQMINYGGDCNLQELQCHIIRLSNGWRESNLTRLGIFSLNTICLFLPLQCCHLSWYQGTASLMPSIRCCLAFATPYNRTSHTCPKMPPSQNPLVRQTPCLSHIHLGTVTQTHLEVAAASPFLIHHLALTPAVHSRCQVVIILLFSFFSYTFPPL